MFTHTGVVANYLTSLRALKAVEDVIARAESLRDSDPRFVNLGIGLAEGELVAACDWRGRLTARPMGSSLTEAVRVEKEPQKYREILRTLRENIYGAAP
jgi:hypothetical protein